MIPIGPPGFIAGCWERIDPTTAARVPALLARVVEESNLSKDHQARAGTGVARRAHVPNTSPVSIRTPRSAWVARCWS
jgi:hypothetical protein